jgi:hypothetical protein
MHAQIDQGELEKSQLPVEFINYEGPHARIETRAQIRGIGAGLGQSLRSGVSRTGLNSRYFVIHSESPRDGDKLDADIFGLGVDTGVDHISNMRLILQGYLEEAYGYGERDAALLARYVTIYNAVYRGHWDYVNARYKGPVLGNLTPEKAGLSIRYDEWPGQTLMLVPLGPGGADSLSALDTSSLGDSRVVEELRKEDDRGLEDRKEMVDLKEREAEEAEQRAVVEREAIGEEEQRIARERARAAEERQQIAGERQQNREDLAAGRTTAGESRQREQDLDRREEAADQKEQELGRREEAVAERREEAQRTEEFAGQKREEAQQEREGIAGDQQDIISREDGAALKTQGILGAVIEVPDTSLGRLLRLDASSGRELARSPLDTVNVRTLSSEEGNILAIAGETRGNGAIRLIEIKEDTLEMLKQGDDDIHPESLLWINGSDLYAITVYQEKTYLGRFNTDLARQARSAAPVNPRAGVLFDESRIVTQREDGSALLLNARDLTE